MSSRCGILLLAVLLAWPMTSLAQDGFSQETLQRLYRELTPAIGLVHYSSEVTNASTGDVSKRDGTALGLVVSPGGLVMVQGHMVLENSQPFSILVTLGRGSDEKEYNARLLKKPDDVNVVFVQLEADTPLNLPHVRFSRESPLELGTRVAIFGLLGEAMDFEPALQECRIGAVLEQPRTTYCLDQAVRFGYVGGPVVNTQGDVVGVVGFDLSPGEGGELYVRSGHPLVYQTALFQRYIDTPPTEKEAGFASEDAWLGVFTQPLTDEFAEYWGLDLRGGLIVSTVVPGSPASQLGLRPGDIITSFNDTPIRARLDRDVLGFTQLVRLAGAGNEVNIEFLREGVPVREKVTVGARPRAARDAEEYEDPHFGLTVRELTTDMRIALNLPEEVQGVIVRRVRRGSPAQVAQIRPLVIIMRMGEYPVASLQDFESAVEKLAEEKPEEVPVFGRVGAATGFFRLSPRW